MSVFSLYQQALAVLDRSRHPLVVLLKNVYADALGSAAAISLSLMQHGLTPTLSCAAPIPEPLTFLLDGLSVVHDPVTLTWRAYDLAVVVDAGSLDRTGLVRELKDFVARGQPLLNIDHHHVHEAFGTVNLVDEEASATTVLVYDLLKLGGWRIDTHIATAVLSGIVADTDNFSNAGTTVRALTVAAECYAKGADVRAVTRHLYHNRPLNALQLWGVILARLRMNERWGIVSTVIRQADFTEFDLNDEAIEGVANFMNGIADMNAALVLTELPNGELRGSMRTTKDTIDVLKVGQALGGGGHKKAAGFTILGRIMKSNGGWKVV